MYIQINNRYIIKHKYEIYSQNKTLYNINIKHIIKISIFATFQQP